MMKRLMIVVPCYNEAEIFSSSAKQLIALIEDLIKKEKISSDSGILFVNDGSRDDTWKLISEAHKSSKYVYGLNLATNVGHQDALFAGLNTVKDICDMSISIDADLQDDIDVMEEMIDKYHAGADIVYGVRNKREKDTFFKRFTAQLFYKVMSAMGVELVYNHADFRLMSAHAMQELSQYKERNLFLRGIVSRIGNKTDCVYYERKLRTKGESKYTLRRMFSLAIDGITSFSIKPITMIAVFGLIIVICSVIALIYMLISYCVKYTFSVWAFLMISIWFLGGVQLLSLGILGQYIGKTYIESKKRPRYHVEEYLDHGKK